MKPIYADRQQAGRLLAERLSAYASKPDVIVLALPRGGVPVGFEIAEILGVALDVYLVRKLGVPGHEELAMGALAAGGVRFLNRELVRQLGISPATIENVVAREQAELDRQSKAFREDRPPPVLKDRTVILVDDGLATGATMAATIMAVREHKPNRIVVAVPVAPPDTCENMARLADEVICPATPPMFGAVGFWYSDFSAVDDKVVRDLLSQSRASPSAHAGR